MMGLKGLVTLLNKDFSGIRVNFDNTKGFNMKPFFCFGSPGQARTADLVINSHPLYRLSYRGIFENA